LSPTPALAAQPTPGRPRFERLDALRGLAMLWMLVFHFCFDLNLYGLITPRQQFLSDPFWTVQRASIVTLFLSCVGLSLAVALHQQQTWPRFWRRWLQVAGCAVLVSAGSALMFPNSWISFGVLHGIAVMLVLGRLLAPLRLWLWPLGALALVLPLWVQHPIFDSRATNWLGLVTRLPVTEDWVPVLPWLGVVLWGLAAGQWLLQPGRAWLTGPLPWPLLRPLLRPLATLGGWPLSFYMLHQPVLIGALLGGRKLGWW
jgi:uncharacterized membrane protein